MSDLVFYLKTCVASNTLIFSMCSLVIIPLAAWLAIRMVAPFIRRMDNDAAWQAPLAAIASTTPGAVFFLLAIVDLGGAYSSGCLHFLWGRIFFASILILAILAFIRASAVAYQRYAQVRSLIQRSQAPCDRISLVAKKIGVSIRIIPSCEPFCALAQPLRPVVLLSQGTVERLDDAQLEAALRHECAHALRGDLLFAAALSFFADLFPLPVNDLTAIYNSAREFAADEHAVRAIEPHQLAAAILSVAGARTNFRGVAALAEDSTALKQRVVRLLEERAAETGAVGRRIVGVGALVTITVLSLMPAIISATNYYACTVKGMSV
ncbi:MAG: M56 family metallopeptidase [Candidatus Eremiobacteraeota bacterium]|nr:M56 family metallopeptidase [Candidatus Eremiobacteraeota bacterium]